MTSLVSGGSLSLHLHGIPSLHAQPRSSFVLQGAVRAFFAKLSFAIRRDVISLAHGGADAPMIWFSRGDV
jgi:hypothetical protein